MTDLEIMSRILLALSFGAILGLETETRTTKESRKEGKKLALIQKQRIGGVRTYTVLSLFGVVAGLLYNGDSPILAYMMFGAVSLIILSAYVMNVQWQKAFGITTELAILITVIVGFAATVNLISLQLLVILIVILTFVLSQKRGISVLVRKIEHSELIDVVKYVIVAVVIFPFLPNQDYVLHDIAGMGDFLLSIGISNSFLNEIVILNPFKMWQYVVLISGFNLLGYFANRILGSRKGLLLTGVFGGIISSTSTIISLAVKSLESKSQYLNFNLGAVGLIANAISFAQIMVLAASASLLFFSGILPISIGMALGSVAVALWYMNRSSKEVKETVKLEYSPFSIGPALKFALLLTGIKVLLQVANFYLGSGAFVFITAMSGTLGMDIATISLGELVRQNEITLSLAAVTFLIANGVNFGAKIFYAKIQGGPLYFRVISSGMVASLLAGALGALVVIFS